MTAPGRALLDTSVLIETESGRRIDVNDLWIAASAVAHGLPIVTQNDDFDPLDGARGLVVVRV